MSIYQMYNPIMRYDWGDKEAIPRLLGLAPDSDSPWAELWMGAHPRASSSIFIRNEKIALNDWIAERPEAALGEGIMRRFGSLPLLAKVLAASRSLSIQAHPNAEQAAEGFARENEQGVPLDAPNRNYRDPHPKPEMLLALEPFQVMAGFRDLADIHRQIGRFDLLNMYEQLTGENRVSETSFPKFLEALLRADQEQIAGWLGKILAQGPDCPERRLMEHLESRFHADAGVLAPLYLQVLELAPDEAIFLDAGVLHAYIHGVGVEIMRSSDNVLRGGLTSKHRDVDELMRVIDWRYEEPRRVRPVPVDDTEQLYSAPTRTFRLSRMKLDGVAAKRTESGPQMVIVMDGFCSLRCKGSRLTIEQGESAFISASAGEVTFDGVCSLFRFWTPE